MKKIITPFVRISSLFFPHAWGLWGLSLYLPLIAILGTTSCDKQNTTCNAVVTVMDSARPVSGATVKLYAGQVLQTGTTGPTGTANFSFALPAVLNVNVSKWVAQNDSLKGSGIIQLQVGSSVSTTVNVIQ